VVSGTNFSRDWIRGFFATQCVDNYALFTCVFYWPPQDPEVGIPLTITLLIVLGYIVMGAIIFGIWEKWEFMEAAYYCFVTISTIGFGDLVPGTNGNSFGTAEVLILTVDGIYIVLGLAIVAMAFNLIQVGPRLLAAAFIRLPNICEQIKQSVLCMSVCFSGR